MIPNRPRLRVDAHFTPGPGGAGAFVSVPSQPQLGFALGGRQTYEWLRRIAPFLDGQTTLDDLCRPLDDRRRRHVESLIAVLHERGFVREAAHDEPHTLDEEVRAAYASVIGFIGRTADSPEARFQRYRESDPLVVGSGTLVAPLVGALLSTGVRTVRVVLGRERSTDVARMRACLSSTLGAAAEGLVQVDAGDDVIGAGLPPPRAVLHVTDSPLPERTERLVRLCDRCDAVFGQATVAGDVGVVGPVGEAGEQRAAAVRELASLGANAPEQPSPWLIGPVPALIANHLCAAYLKHVTGIANAAAHQLVEINLETLRSRLRPVAARSHAA
jgi:hypothetical protein